MGTAAYLHMIWMLAAVAVGTWSGYLGLLRALQGPGGKAPLPGRFNLRLHQWTGIVYYAMLYVGILGGLLMAAFLMGGLWPHGRLWQIHQWLGLAVGVVYAPGAWLGLGLLWTPAGPSRARPIAHMVLNFTACTLIGVQIVLALLAVGGVVPWN
jgi:hypothetical protein